MAIQAMKMTSTITSRLQIICLASLETSIPIMVTTATIITTGARYMKP